jgi:hypothetical protein
MTSLVKRERTIHYSRMWLFWQSGHKPTTTQLKLLVTKTATKLDEVKEDCARKERDLIQKRGGRQLER